CLEKPTLAPRTTRHSYIEAFRLCLGQARYQRLDIAVDAERAGDIVRGPEWQNRQGNLAGWGTAGPLPHRAVTTGDDHEVPSLAEGLLIIVLTRLIFGPETSGFELAH